MTRDWHAERYVAAEGLALAARTIAREWPHDALPGMRDRWMADYWLPALNKALAEYESTKDAP